MLPGVKWIADDSDNIIVDFVGKFENLEVDFQAICNKIGVSLKLPTTNKSNRESDYRKYYTKKTRQIVAEIYQKDIEFFGYTYEGKTTNTINLKNVTPMANKNSQKTVQIQPEEVEILDKHINDDSVVFDLGANLGAWTLEVLKQKKNINLHLFEASPYTYQLLLRNLANYISTETLSLNQIAVSSQDSLQLFNFYPKHPSLSGIYRRNLKVEEKLQLGTPKSMLVPTISLDSYCKIMDIKHINFIKIDVEGAELDVLRGAKKLLKNGKIDYIQFEYGGTYLDAKISLKQVFEYLQKMKYLIFKISPKKLDYKPDFTADLEDYKYSNFLAVNERFRTKFLEERKQMLDLKALCKTHYIKPKGVIHVGAHEGKELQKYQEMGIEKVLFVEANPVVFDRLKTNVAEFANVKAVNYAISNENGTVSLRVTSNEQSSSILPLKRHQEIYRNVKETHQVTVQSITLDNLLQKLEAQASQFNLLNIDIQGAELLAFKGATNLLKHIQAINAEVNYEELYEGCALIDEIDAFLEEHGFERVATTTPYHPSWGYAFYLKKAKITMSTLGKNGRFGNQIFQYAFLKIYAKQHNLYVETPAWIGQYLFGHDDPPISQKLPRFNEIKGRVELPQSRVLNSPAPLKNIDLWGYFQYHTSYYSKYKDYFRSLFKPLPEIETGLQKAVSLLRSKGKTVIGIHLRRIKYDYAIFYTTPSDRYKEWLKEIWETLQDPVLFIASDDLDAVIDDFSEYNPVTVKDLNVELPKANYYPDFYILTQCDVVAISNSSFSFVASMLNDRAKFFCRPSLVNNKIIPFDPWDSYVLLTEKKENLPDSGYKARITTSDSLVVAKNDIFTISAKVQNLSDVTWQRSCVSRIVLAYRWLDEKENVVLERGREGNFERDLQPGEETEVSLKINALSFEGRFILELDMLDEDIAWFKDKGSETAKVNVLVEPTKKVVEVEQKWKLKTPVAFLIYKRPDTTEKVFETIRQAQPPKLLVIADGPKADVSGEAEKCMKTRAVIDKVDWDCEVITNYSEINLGCRDRVSSGLDWVFEQVEEAIILEDDCLPHPTFFRFCEELLDRYRDNEQIMMISGTNLQFEHLRTHCSYYFSRYNHVWGWASWRSAWHFYDKKMESWSKIKNTNWLGCLLKDKTLVEYWSKIFERTCKGEIDTWDYQFRFAMWTRNSLAIIPSNNLISNIGWGGEDATHTRNPNHKVANVPRKAMTFPLVHPPEITRNMKADKFEEIILCPTKASRRLELLQNLQPNFDTNKFGFKPHFLGDYEDENQRYLQTESLGLKESILIVTSIAPGNIEKQKVAIQSWYDLGFSIVSLNIESEAKQLQPIYDNVDFCIVKRDGNDLYGKPYVYINDLLDYLSEYGSRIGGIINSDIHLRADNKFASFIFEQTQDSIVFASRYDVESLEATEGKIYQPGFDVFFFDKNLLKDFPRSELCLGVPCWDLWIPFIAVQQNWKLKYVNNTVAVHIYHDQNWSQENWQKAWLKFCEFEIPDAEKIVDMWKSERQNELNERIRKEIAPTIREIINNSAESIYFEKTIKIAHIINPVIVNESSDLHIAQPITFATMKTAQQQVQGKVDVTLYTAQYPEDHAIIPEGFIKTPDLDRSILDIANFQVPRKLPLIKDILDRLYEAAPDADYLIYTNADIALQPHFYTEVAKLIEQEYDAFIINRRTIPDHYKDISEIPQMYAEKGEPHPGQDCFIFKRSLYEKFYLENHVIGVGFCFRSMLLNCLCHGEKFQEFRDLHLTFHIGNQETWKDSKLQDYFNHNKNEAQKIFDYYLNQNLLPNHPLIEEKFSTFAKPLSSPTPSVELPADATAKDYYKLGQKLEKEKQLNQALKAYQRAIDIDPNHFFYHQSLANTFRQLNQDIQAISTYQKAIKINPSFSFSYYYLGNLLAKHGKLQEAMDAYQQALQLYPNFKLYQSQLDKVSKLIINNNH